MYKVRCYLLRAVNCMVGIMAAMMIRYRVRSLTKGQGPTHTIILEHIPFKEGSVKHVGIVDEFLEIFQGDHGCGGGMSQEEW